MSKEKHARTGPRAGGPSRMAGGNLSRTLPVPLPFGVASAVLRDGVLLSVEWERTSEDLEEVLSEKFPSAKGIEPEECRAGRVLRAYADGRPVPPETVAAVPLDWNRLRDFPRRVLEELAAIPYGRTITYGALAARAGKERSARAVGAVVARNPWPVIVPCHRVVGKGGKLVGFGKGIHAKKILLSFEEKNLASGL